MSALLPRMAVAAAALPARGRLCVQSAVRLTELPGGSGGEGWNPGFPADPSLSASLLLTHTLIEPTVFCSFVCFDFLRWGLTM